MISLFKAGSCWCRAFTLLGTVGSIAILKANAELYFPPSLINGTGENIADLSRFSTSGHQLPGSYLVDVWLNGERLHNRTVHFITTDEENHESRDRTGLTACFTPAELVNLGIFLKDTAAVEAMAEQNSCIPIEKIVPQAYSFFDFPSMKLEINIPQASLINTARGYIPPEMWDDGITAFLLNYRFSGTSHNMHGRENDSQYLNLSSGFNLGAWRFRDERSWSNHQYNGNSEQRWQHQRTYAWRAIAPLRSEIFFGDSTTSSDVFDSVGYRGINLATQDYMYPDSMRGFAPVIRGTAGSNAHVTVKQNGYDVYQTNVPTGDFIIDDLFPMYSSGDLSVTVTEADGTSRSFVVPYSSVPALLREGRTKYTLTAGRFRSASSEYEDPFFTQATLVQGLPYGTTIYGGAQYSDDYRAFALGGGLNMGSWGAISADITHANSTLADDSQHEGQSVRFLYARSLNSLGTTIQLTGYRYSTQGFYTLDETTLKRMRGWMYEQDTDVNGELVPRPITDYYNLYDNKRQRIQASVSQRLGALGSLYLTGIRQTYWNRSDASDSLQAGFSSRLGNASYNISYSHNRVAGFDRKEHSGFLTVSLPLGKRQPGKHSPVYSTFTGSHDNKGNASFQAGISGTALEENNLNWSMSYGNNRHSGDSGNVSMHHYGTYASSDLGLSRGHGFRQFNYGIAGGAILHSEGITFGQSTGETSVLVAAPGASGVPVNNGTGVKTDWRGYAIQPYATAWRENRVALDVNQLDEETEIENSSTRVIPTRGAVTRAEFKTRNGVRALITLTRNGKRLPFGTMVTTGESSGIVNDNGLVYLSGLEQSGTLKAQWGNGKEQQCSATWQLPENRTEVGMAQLDINCE